MSRNKENKWLSTEKHHWMPDSKNRSLQNTLKEIVIEVGKWRGMMDPKTTYENISRKKKPWMNQILLDGSRKMNTKSIDWI